MTPKFFKTPSAFRNWLEAHHASAKELWVGYYKKGTGKPSITWPKSVDEALCFGWIDGSYEQRPAELVEPYAATLKRNKAAWQFFHAQPPYYRKTMTWWIVSAKQEETRLRRLNKLIEESAAGRVLYSLP